MGRGGDVHLLRIGRVHKPGRPGQHGRPGLALVVQRAQQQGGQLLEQLTVLVGHVVAHHQGANGGHAIAQAHTLLQRLLACVEGLGHAATGVGGARVSASGT
ncbi:hypothetical protein D3C71_1802620 [compost metagenome]